MLVQLGCCLQESCLLQSHLVQLEYCLPRLVLLQLGRQK
jgi:hypothetical protein